MECSRGKEFEIETALREALANAIRHGCGNDAHEERRGVRGLRRVEGDADRRAGPRARASTPAPIPSPTLGQNVFRHHGRGIYLINQLMDEVSFDKGGTEIRMLKR